MNAYIKPSEFCVEIKFDTTGYWAITENLSILVEYGVPKSAINKLENKLSENLNEDQVLDEIKNKGLIEISDLIDYEKEKIRENL